MTKPKVLGTARRTKATAAAQPKAAAPAKSKASTLEIEATGQTKDRVIAQAAADGVVSNAFSLVAFGKGTFGELSLTDCAMVLKSTAQGFNDGDLSAAVTTLSSQAVALNAIFGELARRSALNMGEYIGAAETYMRLALKAQSQCRTTIETLAAIKNPPVVFARQANINNGGQQQVNNGLAPGNARAVARPGENASGPNELLEDRTHGRTQVDTGATTAAGRTNQNMGSVETLDRPPVA